MLQETHLWLFTDQIAGSAVRGRREGVDGTVVAREGGSEIKLNWFFSHDKTELIRF